MTTRIYKVTHDGKHRLVRASTQAMARSHVAKSSIEVVVASPDDTYELAQQGVKVEETGSAPAQKEIGE
jgi:hypothetical protein